ncbi:Coilin-like protein [Drosera capensis]
MTDPIRLRLLFDGGGGGEKNILSKAQGREGLKRSWMLLKPQQQHASISDVVSHNSCGRLCFGEATFSFWKKKPRQIANGKVENSVQDKQGECCQLDGADKKRRSSTLDSKSVHEDAKTTSKPSEVPAETKKKCSAKEDKEVGVEKEQDGRKSKAFGGCLPVEAPKVNAVAEKDSVINKPSEPPKASLAMKDVAADSGVAKTINGNSLEHLPADPDSDVDREIAPIIVRPGHIRFTPYEKDGNIQQNQDLKGVFRCNGTTNKRKGQKWGTERQPAPHRYQQKNFNGDLSDRKMKEKRPVDARSDFEKLVPLVDPPEQGDVIAYRLLELSSSFSPELSSFRVGKIQSVDPESNMILLIPVPEYPLQFEKKTDDDGCGDPGLPFETSQYKDDGSLEIDFNSLVNARMVKRGNLGPAEASPHLPVANGQPSTSGVSSRGVDETTVSDWVISASGTQLITDTWETHSQASGNGDGNPWEELAQALDAKRADLQQDSK